MIGPGHTVLDMHIPGATPLTLESVRDALEQAWPFFDQFYPDTPFVAFVCESIDLATAPRDTRLRRAVINHLQQGGEMRCGGFLFLRRDLPRFGTQIYRDGDPLSQPRA